MRCEELEPLSLETAHSQTHRTTQLKTRVRACAHARTRTHTDVFISGVAGPESLVKNLADYKSQGPKWFLSHKVCSERLG